MEIASREELLSKINRTVMELWQRGLGNVQREMRRRDEACVCARGGHFEDLLYNLWTWSGQEEMETLNN